MYANGNTKSKYNIINFYTDKNLLDTTVLLLLEQSHLSYAGIPRYSTVYLGIITAISPIKGKPRRNFTMSKTRMARLPEGEKV